MNEVETGKLGEHICCVRLIKLGFGAEIVNLNKTDVIVDIRGKLLRVQVKSSSLIADSSRKMRSSYQFAVSHSGKKKPLNLSHCDVMAFVSIPKEKVYFMHIDLIGGASSKRINKKYFEEEDLEQRTFIKCLKHMGVIK